MNRHPGQPATMQSPEAAPVNPALGSAQPTLPGAAPGYGSAPIPAGRSRKPIFVGVGVIGLIVAIVVGALLVASGGDHGASPGMPAAMSSAAASATPHGTEPAATPSATPAATAGPTTHAYPGTYSPTGPMGTARMAHTATLLSDGRALIAGGLNFRDGDPGFRILVSAELYDPKSGTFSPTGSMGTARVGHTATLLPDGRVLIAGGGDGSGTTASAELYS